MQARKQLRARSKVWLELDGEPVFGEGRKRLLEAIESYGSITRAASQVGISYRRAWGYLRAMEFRLGARLIETCRGGTHGGGARLTEEARVLMRTYEALVSGMRGVRSRGEFF